MKRNWWRTVWAATRYEWLMQIRRPALWIAMALVLLLTMLLNQPGWKERGLPAAQVAAEWAWELQVLLPIVFGVLLADRLRRDNSLRVADLLASVPAGIGARLAGKYLGSTLATGAPFALAYLLGLGTMLVARPDGALLLPALLAFAAINVPGLLFVAAFSIGCPAFMWVPLYQFLFVSYWFWGNLVRPWTGIPTISTTMLTPIGTYADKGFFGMDGAVQISAPAWEAWASIVLLLGVAALVLVVTRQMLVWQQAQR